MARSPPPTGACSRSPLADEPRDPERGPMNELERNELRRLVDKAKRRELDKVQRLRKNLSDRSTTEIKRATAERKAILAAAQQPDDTGLGELAVVARCGPDVYLLSVGMGSACVLDLGGHLPLLSAPEDIYALLASDVQWLPFTDDAKSILAFAGPMIDANGARL